MKAAIDNVAKKVAEETGVFIDYLVGTMIELPRAALRVRRSPKPPNFSPSVPTT